jgi:hypothetical protein
MDINFWGQVHGSLAAVRHAAAVAARRQVKPAPRRALNRLKALHLLDGR